MYVIVTPLDRRWDDGPEDVIGPFATREEADAYAEEWMNTVAVRLTCAAAKVLEVKAP